MLKMLSDFFQVIVYSFQVIVYSIVMATLIALLAALVLTITFGIPAFLLMVVLALVLPVMGVSASIGWTLFLQSLVIVIVYRIVRTSMDLSQSQLEEKISHMEEHHQQQRDFQRKLDNGEIVGSCIPFFTSQDGSLKIRIVPGQMDRNGNVIT